MFSDGNRFISCYNCETHVYDDTCGDLEGPDASRKTWPCPAYADAGRVENNFDIKSKFKVLPGMELSCT